MRFLLLIGLTIVELSKQAWRFPPALLAAIRSRRERNDLDRQEAERLDRIRNPSKYRGK